MKEWAAMNLKTGELMIVIHFISTEYLPGHILLDGWEVLGEL